jgi:hypothetical protein
MFHNKHCKFKELFELLSESIYAQVSAMPESDTRNPPKNQAFDFLQSYRAKAENGPHSMLKLANRKQLGHFTPAKNVTLQIQFCCPAYEQSSETGRLYLTTV